MNKMPKQKNLKFYSYFVSQNTNNWSLSAKSPLTSYWTVA
jgi:hypothetical protein